MIKKQEQPNMAKVATIEFGFGSVHMISGAKEVEGKSTGVLFLDTHEPQPIGVKQPYEQPMIVSDSDHEVLMTFENIESIDALISSLQDVKKTMNLNKVSNRVEFDARCNAIIDELIKLHALYTNNEEHHVLATTCMDLIDRVTTIVLCESTSCSIVGESLADIQDSVKALYYNDATPANDTVCPELLVLIERLIIDLVDLL